jgi:GntR family transcriptional repressor for pyruvate dehydrogenase complex
LGVSRTVVREAVRMLVTKGLLETRPGVGTVVTEISSQQITEPLSIWMSTRQKNESLEQLYQVRRILETAIAQLASEHATPEDIQRLRKIIQQMHAAVNDPDEFAASDVEFHAALTETAHNPLLFIILESIQNLLTEIRMMVQSYRNLPDEVIPEHQRILDCVEAHDPECAARAMQDHIDTSRRIQQEVLRAENK